MNIDITVLTSILAVAISLYAALNNTQRNTRKDSQENAIQHGMVMEKLANISIGIADLKSELSTLSEEQKGLRERTVKNELKIKMILAYIEKRDGQVFPDEQQ